MKIGIDISQIVYEGTGIANYTRRLVETLVKISAKGGPASDWDKKNEYVLFFSSLRRKLDSSFINGLTSSRVKIKQFRLPPLLLEFLWNKLHIFPIEWFIGPVDVFLSSDWVQPPTVKAKKITTIHDLIIYKHPESFQPKGGHDIVTNQKRRLKWVKKEADLIMCDSEATKKDVMGILKIKEEKLRVVYPGGLGN